MHYGALSQTNTTEVNTTEIYDNKLVLSILPCNNGSYVYETATFEKYYDNDFARIKPFMLSYGRIKIQNVILQNLDKVVRAHTDGIICSSPITNTKLGTELGMLKFEGKGNCEIINNNNYIFIEIADET